MQSFRFYPAVARWFEQTFGSPTEPQARGWPAIQSGRHVLISAPTGSGKTLAAFLASLDILFREGMKAELPDETQVVYVSPLKALSNDIQQKAARLRRATARQARLMCALKFGPGTQLLRNGRHCLRSRRTFLSRRRNLYICCSLPSPGEGY